MGQIEIEKILNKCKGYLLFKKEIVNLSGIENNVGLRLKQLRKCPSINFILIKNHNHLIQVVKKKHFKLVTSIENMDKMRFSRPMFGYYVYSKK